VLGEMADPRRGRTVCYRRFVEAGLLREIASPLEAVQCQTVLGSASFARRVRDWMSEVGKGRQEVTALRRGTRVLSPEAVLQKGRSTVGCRWDDCGPREIVVWRHATWRCG
jgi:hypothetical protein